MKEGRPLHPIFYPDFNLQNTNFIQAPPGQNIVRPVDLFVNKK